MPARAAPRPSRPERGVAAAVMLATTPLLALSAALIVREQAVMHADADLIDQGLTLQAHRPPPPPGLPLNRGSRPAALLSDGLLRARAARIMAAGPQRARLLEEAAAELAVVCRSRRYWGEAWTAAAFVEALRFGEGSASALAAYIRSYADAPYLRRAAGWRIEFGLRQWSRLDSTTRHHVLDEAVWLSRSNAETLDAILAIVRGTPAYPGFMMRWIWARQGDPDFGSINIPAP